jgi:hypothetical protein
MSWQGITSSLDIYLYILEQRQKLSKTAPAIDLSQLPA